MEDVSAWQGRRGRGAALPPTRAGSDLGRKTTRIRDYDEETGVACVNSTRPVMVNAA